MQTRKDKQAIRLKILDELKKRDQAKASKAGDHPPVIEVDEHEGADAAASTGSKYNINKLNKPGSRTSFVNKKRN